MTDEFHRLNAREYDVAAGAGSDVTPVNGAAMQQQRQQQRACEIQLDGHEHLSWVSESQGQSQLSRDVSRVPGPVCEGDQEAFDDEDDWGDFGEFEEPSAPNAPLAKALQRRLQSLMQSL